jgi:hypothetical protein
MLTAPESYEGRDTVFSERNWHDCDEHQRAARARNRAKLGSESLHATCYLRRAPGLPRS